MPAASLERMGQLHQLLADDLVDYFKRTPPLKRRVGRLTLARQMTLQSGLTLHDCSPRLQKQLARLHAAYIKALAEQIEAGTASPGLVHEAGLLLRSTRTTAESIREVATRPTTKLALVPHQHLPFHASGQPTGHQ